MANTLGSRVRAILILVGSILVLVGLLFVGQGSGWFPFPQSSFMVGASAWVVRGAALAAVGVVLLLAAQRVGRR